MSCCASHILRRRKNKVAMRGAGQRPGSVSGLFVTSQRGGLSETEVSAHTFKVVNPAIEVKDGLAARIQTNRRRKD